MIDEPEIVSEFSANLDGTYVASRINEPSEFVIELTVVIAVLLASELVGKL